MAVPEPVLSPDDDKDIPPAVGMRVRESLSRQDRRLLEFMRRVVRVELGEQGRPVLVYDASLDFDPFRIFWLLHFGVLTLAVDSADRVFLVTTDTNDFILDTPCKRKRRRRKSGTEP
jgi:hypothetical protein